MSKVGGVNNNYNTNWYQTQNNTQNKNKGKNDDLDNLQKDVLELSSGNQSAQTDATKQLYTRDMATVNALKTLSQGNLDTVRSLVQKLMSTQSYTAKGQFDMSLEAWSSLQSEDGKTLESYGIKLDFSFSFEFTSDTSKEVQAEAEAMIAEDGPLGVKQVSDNILKFAKAISGGDPSKIDMLRNACQKGYDQVAALFGGADNIPEVSKKTLEAVMQGFDDWEAEVSGASAEAAV